MKRLIFFMCCMFVCSGQAFAAKVFRYTGYQIGSGVFSPLSCDGVVAALKGGNLNNWLPLTSCNEADIDAAVRATGGGTFFFSRVDGKPYQIQLSVASGNCQAGRDAGPADVPVAYVDKDNIDRVMQVIRDPMALSGSQGGCVIKASSVGGCFYYTASQPALQECTVYFQETGADGGSDSPPDTTTPAYTGGTGGGGGGGTTPGDGGGTTPGDGGGTTPGGGGTTPGGGGTTPGGGGTTPGGGGTTPGDGGGGTAPGGGGSTPGGGGTGDTQAHCGAPGQPACSINEGNTPTGIGGLMDALTKLVDGLGEARQTGMDDAKSDQGKNTSLPFSSASLPSGVCVNPTVTLPAIGGSWTVDVCKYFEMLGPAFEALWVFAFVMATISMVARATSKPVA
jgi:hypothetical protein